MIQANKKHVPECQLVYTLELHLQNKYNCQHMYSIPLFLMPQIPDESTICQNIYTLQGVFIIGHTRLHTSKLIHTHSEYVKKSGVSCLWLNTKQS